MPLKFYSVPLSSRMCKHGQAELSNPKKQKEYKMRFIWAIYFFASTAASSATETNPIKETLKRKKIAS